MRVVKYFGFLCILSIYPALLSAAQDLAFPGLSLKDAERLALQRDTLVKGLEQEARAYSEQSMVAQTWPDPRIKFGAQAVPIDTFDLEQEPMTQIVLGYQQMLPRGNSLEYAAESMNAMSRMQIAKSKKRQREVLMNVRHAWLDVVLQNESIRIIKASRQLFVKMLDISQLYYAEGRQQKQDVVQAELEISLVDDRLQQAYSKLIVAQANLAKWVGEENIQNDLIVSAENLNIKTIADIQALINTVEFNPELTVVNEKVISQQTRLHMADEQYTPQWGFDINYGKRSGNNPDGSERDDFLTAMVTVDLPLFTENRQDRELSAAKQRLQSSRYEQIDVRRLLVKRLKEISGRLDKLNVRHQLYKDKVLPQSRQNSEVALRGYQSGVVTFFTLTRARITELNTRLSDLQIKVDYNKAYAELQYLIGERS